MTLNRLQIEQLLPHAGAMCFLDCVTGYDPHTIWCSAATPNGTHPLARNGTNSQVPAIAAVEYAAQAIALHGALLDAALTHRNGMLATLRDVSLYREWLPMDEETLSVQATLISRIDHGCLYSFDVSSAHQAIASGRLIVVFTSSSEPCINN